MANFKIIKGTFHVQGFSPDGDSIRFKPERPDAFAGMKFKDKKAEANPFKQLRLEAIDALETHYEGYHQSRSFGFGALQKLLSYLGIVDVEYSLTLTLITKATDGTPGFIATDGVDGFNRPISLLFGADAPLVDGTELAAAALPLDSCINFKMCADGLVYPTFYTTTDAVLVEKFGTAARAARDSVNGIYVIDRTEDFTLFDLRTLFEDVLILPKLFRRITSFVDTNSDFAAMPDYMKRNGDKLLILDHLTGKTTKSSFDKIVEISGRRFKMKVRPENVLFVPKA